MGEAIASLLKLLTDTRTLVQGAEGQLLKRQRIGASGIVTAFLGLVLGAAALLADGKAIEALTQLGHTLHDLVYDSEKVSAGARVLMAGGVLLVLGTGVYVLVRYHPFPGRVARAVSLHGVDRRVQAHRREGAFMRARQ